MMNGIALFLILTSLLSGTVWPPALQGKNPAPDVIEKEGPVEVVVEYNKEGEAATKISISPKHQNPPDNIEQKVDIHRPNPGELMSDKFNEKVEGAKEGFNKGVDKVKEYGSEASDKVKDTAEKVKDGDMVDIVKRGAEDIVSNVSSYVKKIKESPPVDTPKRAVEDVASNGSSYVEKIKESTLVDTPKRAAEDLWRNVTSYGEEIKESRLVDTPKRAAEDLWRNVTRAVQFVHTFVRGKVYKLKEQGKQVTDWGQKAIDANTVTKTVKSGGEFVADTLKDGGHIVEEMEGKAIHMVKEEGKAVVRNWADSVIRVVHLLASSMAFGMSAWVTFFSCYILQNALPREQFGMLQSKVYPVYFTTQAYSIAVTLLTHLLYHEKMIVSNRVELLCVINMMASLLLTLGNLLYLEPYTTELMHQRLKLEKDAGRGRITSNPTSGIADAAGDPVSATTERQEEVEEEPEAALLHEKINKFNQMSSFANSATIISLTLHMVYLGLTV